MHIILICIYCWGILLTAFMSSVRSVYPQEIRDLFQYHKNQWKKLTWIADILDISYNTLKIWNKKMVAWEVFRDKRFWNSTKKKTFSDEDLKRYIEHSPNATLKQIGHHFHVTDVAILKRLRKAGYSYKKKRWGIKKETRKNENNFKRK